MRKRSRDILAYLLRWRRRHLNDNQFVLVVSFFVGIFTACAGLLLKWLIGQIEHLLTQSFVASTANWLYLVYPIIGIWLTMLFIRYVVRDDISHGVTKILFALARKQSQIKAHNTWSSIVASAITIGFGGSVGAEAPIVLTGSAIGSTLGRMFHLSSKQMMLLVGCGAAGAVAGIFKAPIAGLVFVLEVLMLDLTMTSLLPLLVSSVTAAALTFAVSGINPIFEFHLQDAFNVERLPAYLALGGVCGLVALYFTRTMNMLEGVFRKLQGRYKKLALGAIMLSLLIYLFPSLYGEGYDLITLLLNGTGEADWNTAMDRSLFYGSNYLLLYLFLIIIFKVFASTATNGGGGCGGIFAPSLFLGCICGFIFCRMWNIYDVLGFQIPERNFAMLGMCGLMSGVMHAPLTGIFLIAELTGGYQLFMPLMVVSVMAYLTIKAFEPHSIYAMRLARKGELITHDKDNAILTLLSMESLIEKNYVSVEAEWNLTKVVIAIEKSRRNIFPVVNKANQLVGVMSLDSVRKYIFRPELYKQYKVAAFMKEPPATLSINDTLKEATSKFDETDAWNLPVVDDNGEYVGFISRSGLFSAYRQTLVDITAE